MTGSGEPRTALGAARWIAAALCAMSALLTAPPSFAQDWPARPIRLIATFAPGGSADPLARLIATKLGQALGQNVFVDNRAGGGGVLGADVLAKSPADGYTFGLSGFASHVAGPVANASTFDPIEDFTHIAFLAGVPTVPVVPKDSEIKTLAEFVTLGRTRKDGISVATGGVGSTSHLHLEMFRKLSNTNLVHVPYRGGSPALVDVLAGQVPSAFTTLTSAEAFIHDGRLRALAISSSRRLKMLPDLPTFAEQGFPSIVGTSWFGISAPRGLDPQIAARVQKEIQQILKMPDVEALLQTMGMVPDEMDTPTFNSFFRAEIKQWVPVARSLK